MQSNNRAAAGAGPVLQRTEFLEAPALSAAETTGRIQRYGSG